MRVDRPKLHKTLVAKVLSGSLGFFCALCSVAQSRAGQATETIHIAVQVRWLTGDPVSYLHKEDFRTTANGHPLRVEVDRSPSYKSGASNSTPTYVLLLFSPAYRSSPSTVDTILREVPASLPQAAVSVVQPDGTATSYVSKRTALIAELSTAKPQSEDLSQALTKLGSQVGRRALVYVTDTRGSTPVNVRERAASEGALVYQVGGDPAANYTTWGEKTTTGNLPLYGGGLYGDYVPNGNGFTVVNNTEVRQSFATSSIRQVHVERSIHAAFRDIARDGEGYYDLEVAVPLGEKAIVLGLTLKQDYQISAQGYRLDHRSVPDIILPK